MNVKKAPSLAQTDYSRVMFTANLLSFYNSFSVTRRTGIWLFCTTWKNHCGSLWEPQFRAKVLMWHWLRGFFREAVDGSLKDVARRILSGDYLDDEGNDLFGDRFDELRKNFIEPRQMESEHGSGNWLDALWDDLMQRVFHGRGSLRVVQLSNAPGEFGYAWGKTHISAS